MRKFHASLVPSNESNASLPSLFRGQMRRIARIASVATFVLLLVCLPIVTGFAQDTTVLKGNHPVEAETLAPVGRADAESVA